MKMFKALIVVMGGLLVIATASHSSQIVRQSNNLLDRQTKGANLQNVIVGQAVVNAFVNVGAPGGVGRCARRCCDSF